MNALMDAFTVEQVYTSLSLYKKAIRITQGYNVPSSVSPPFCSFTYPTSSYIRYSSTMPSSDPEALNASGLTPVQSKALKERSVEPHESKIIEAVKEVGMRVNSIIASC